MGWFEDAVQMAVDKALEKKQQTQPATTNVGWEEKWKAEHPNSKPPYKLGSAEFKSRMQAMLADRPYQRGGTSVPSSSNYSVLDQDALVNGRIDLSQSNLGLRGANAVTISSAGFSFTWNVSQVTLYWDGTNGSQVIVQRRSDKTREVIPPGSIAIGGTFAPNTTYYCLPFWTPSNRCQIGWVPGTLGTPQILFSTTTDLNAVQQQSYQEREPLSAGYMSFTTGAAPGGGGPKGGCPMLGTEIVGLDGAEWTGRHEKWSDWWHIETSAGGVNVVPEHRFYDELGNAKMVKDFQIGDLITHRDGFFEVLDSYRFLRACTKVVVTVPKNGLYWANGYLSHNSKIAVNPE